MLLLLLFLFCSPVWCGHARCRRDRDTGRPARSTEAGRCHTLAAYCRRALDSIESKRARERERRPARGADKTQTRHRQEWAVQQKQQQKQRARSRPRQSGREIERARQTRKVSANCSLNKCVRPRAAALYLLGAPRDSERTRERETHTDTNARTAKRARDTQSAKELCLVVAKETHFFATGATSPQGPRLKPAPLMRPN